MVPPWPGLRYPLGRDLGPVTRVPVEVLWDGDGVPPRKDMEPVEVYGMVMGYPPPPQGVN